MYEILLMTVLLVYELFYHSLTFQYFIIVGSGFAQAAQIYVFVDIV